MENKKKICTLQLETCNVEEKIDPVKYIVKYIGAKQKYRTRSNIY